VVETAASAIAITVQPFSDNRDSRKAHRYIQVRIQVPEFGADPGSLRGCQGLAVWCD